ncbi:MAG: hypothetical protein AAGA30_17265, partial [Planctomycetota bacterium]
MPYKPKRDNTTQVGWRSAPIERQLWISFPARKGLHAELLEHIAMWRSFFLAVGIGLFLMGGQALVIDHVVVPKNTKLQRLITKIMSDEEAAKESSPPQVAVKNNVLPNAAPWNAPNPKPQNDNFGYDSGSRYGPSRFSGPAYGNYGGQRMTSNQGFTGLGSQNQRGVPNTTAAQLASYNAGAANVA